MEAATANGVQGIIGECGGVCSCGTCHVELHDKWIDIVGKPNEVEASMLECLENVSECSRLGCQVTITEELNGLIAQVIDE